MVTNRLAAALGLFFWFAGAADADPVTARFEAVVTSTGTFPGSPLAFPFAPVPAGTVIVGIWTFDDGTADDLPLDPLRGYYTETGAGWDVSITFAGNTVGRGGPGGHVRTGVEIVVEDWYALEWTGVVGNGSIPMLEARIFARGPLGAAFADDSLPLVPPDAAVMTGERRFTMLGPVVDAKFTWFLDSNVTSFSVVPEPSSLCLLVVPGLLLGTRLRRHLRTRCP
jgi:hypothetical protein